MSRSASEGITESQSRLRSQHADTDSMTGAGRFHGPTNERFAKAYAMAADHFERRGWSERAKRAREVVEALQPKS